MTTFMSIVAGIMLLAGMLASMLSSTIVHSIQADIYYLISAILWVGAHLTNTLNKNHAALIKQQAQQNYRPPEPGTKSKSCSWCDAEVSVTASVCPKCGKVL